MLEMGLILILVWFILFFWGFLYVGLCFSFSFSVLEVLVFGRRYSGVGLVWFLIDGNSVDFSVVVVVLIWGCGWGGVLD